MQTVDKIEPCYPLFNSDEYQSLMERKRAFEEPHAKEKVQEIFNDTVLGFNKFGKEVVRVTIEEPVLERPAKHANSI